MKNSIAGDGIYRSFDDFRSDVKTPVGSIKLSQPKDSVYTFDATHPDGSTFHVSPYAVVKNGVIYTWLYKDYYIPLIKTEQEYYFRVPKGFSNLYEIMSLEIVNAKQPFFIPLPGLSLAGMLVSEVVLSSINESGKSLKRKKINENKNTGNDYRTGVIDLYSGDVIY